MSTRAIGFWCVLLAGASACGGAKDQPQTPPPAVTTSTTNPADVAFMGGMIGHHQQALVMAAMATTHGAGEKLKYLANKIRISQTSEIELMQDWLRTNGQPLPDSMSHMHMMMPGMLSPGQLAELDAAKGVEFERLFLNLMIQHHRGALTMVETLFASPGSGQDTQVFQLANDAKNDQQAEIDVMESMLNALPGSSNR